MEGKRFKLSQEQFDLLWLSALALFFELVAIRVDVAPLHLKSDVATEKKQLGWQISVNKGIFSRR